MPDEFEWGFPTHLRAEGHNYLTVCGVFAKGVPGRITGVRKQSNCYHCISEAPATAWVVLPDGTHIARRCTSIENYEYAVASFSTLRTDRPWVLSYWAKDRYEAVFLANLDRPSRQSKKTAPQLLKVQYATVKKDA